MPNPYKKAAEDAANAPLNILTFIKSQREKRKIEKDLQRQLESGWKGK